MARRVPWVLVLAIVVYVALRALMLATNFESFVMPMYELYPMGTMAELALRGVHFPLRYYYDNAAGQLLIGQSTIPVYWLFGSSYMALKILPATLGLATLVVLWKLLDEHVSRLAANFGALLFALAPSTLVRYSVLCSGNHFENLFFTTLFLYAFFRLQAGPKTFVRLALAGLAAGFAIFVFLGAIIPVGICVGVHLGLRGWKRSLRDASLAFVGFAVGIAPLVVVNAVTSGRGLGFLTAKFGDAGGPTRQGGIGERIVRFVTSTEDAAGTYQTVWGLSSSAWAFLFIAAAAIAYLASVPTAAKSLVSIVKGFFQGGSSPADESAEFERAKLVPFVLYLPLAALAYGISNFRIGDHADVMQVGGYRYYLPTLLFAIVLLAVWAARFWQRGGATRIVGALLFSAPLVCGATNVVLVDWSFDEVGNGWRYEGYNFAQMSRGLASGRNALSREEIVASLRSFPTEVRERVLRGLGSNLAFAEIAKSRKRVGAEAWTLELTDLLAGFPAEWHLLLANGAGTGMRQLVRFDGRTGELPELLKHVRPQTGPLAEEVNAGAAFAPPQLPIGRDSRDIITEDIELAKMPIPLMPAFMRGFGLACGRLAKRGVPSELARVQALKDTIDSADFQEGWKRGFDGFER